MGNIDVGEALKKLVQERNWQQFHSPENLAKSISIEAAELLECFQWSPDADPARVREELADVLTYAYFLARAVDASPEELILEKLKITASKYPVDKSYGRSEKYDRL